MTIYQYDTGSIAHIAYFQKPLRTQVLSYNSSVSCKSGMSLLCYIIKKEAEYESIVVIGRSEQYEYNVIGQE